MSGRHFGYFICEAGRKSNMNAILFILNFCFFFVFQFCQAIFLQFESIIIFHYVCFISVLILKLFYLDFRLIFYYTQVISWRFIWFLSLVLPCLVYLIFQILSVNFFIAISYLPQDLFVNLCFFLHFKYFLVFILRGSYSRVNQLVSLNILLFTLFRCCIL